MKDKLDLIIFALLLACLGLTQVNMSSMKKRITLLEDVALNLDKRALTCEQGLLAQGDVNKAQLDWNTYQNMYNEWVHEQLTKKRGKVL